MKISTQNNTRRQQQILARDLLQLAIDHWSDIDTIERVSDYFFSLGRIFEELDSDTPVEWDEIYTLLDTQYTLLRGDSLQTSPLRRIKESYDDIQQALQ